MGMPDIDVQAMTVDARLALIGILWDSLDEADVPLTQAQQRELDRRLPDMDANSPAQVSWDEARARIQSQRTTPKPQP